MKKDYTKTIKIGSVLISVNVLLASMAIVLNVFMLNLECSVFLKFSIGMVTLVLEFIATLQTISTLQNDEVW